MIHSEKVSLTQDDIDRINRFVRLESPKSNKAMIKCLLILIIMFIMFFVGNCVELKTNLFTSHWMVFIPFAAILIAWGIFLHHTLEKRQIDFFLYEFFVGLYLTAEFFSLGFSISIQMAHQSVWFPIILTAAGILIISLLVLYRVEFFYGKIKLKDKYSKEEIKKSRNRVILGIILIAVGFFIFRIRIRNTPSQVQNIAEAIVSFIVGYVMSIPIIFIGNYAAAKKYKDVVYLYEDGELKKSGHLSIKKDKSVK